MANQFKVGDVVIVKSEPRIRMTVESVDGDIVTCVWFDKTNQKRGSFGSGTLQIWVNPAGIYRL